MVIVCENSVSFHEIYSRVIGRSSAMKKQLIFISKRQSEDKLNSSYQFNSEIETNKLMEIQDRPWLLLSKLECVQINVKSYSSQESFRNIFHMLTEPHYRNIAVVFIQGIIQDDFSSLKNILPEYLKLIYNRTENRKGSNAEGFAAIIVNRSLNFHRIFPVEMCNPKLISGIQLFYNESSISLYSVFGSSNAEASATLKKQFLKQFHSFSKIVLCMSPVFGSIVNKQLKSEYIKSQEGVDIRHGSDLTITDFKHFRPEFGQDYVLFVVNVT